MKKIAIFASGNGSNFEAIHDAILNKRLNVLINVLISDKIHSNVVQKAKNRGIDTFVFNAKDYDSKQDYERHLLEVLTQKQTDLIVLAGYMKIIGTTLLEAYPKKIINIHPSLLPLFKGKDAIGQAIKSQTRVTGVTVHYIDEGVDTGEVIEQRELNITNLRTRNQIETEIHKMEHILYPEVIKKLLEDQS